MKEYKITKEKILAMASECSEVKAVLKKGFPEAFKEELVPIGHAVKIELWHACGEDRYAIRFFYMGDPVGTLWANGTLETYDDYEIEKDNTHGEYCFKFYKKEK